MDLKIKMKDAGIVGAGGAGFPSYAKLADGADVLVINGAECEPLLYTDYILLKRELAMVVAGITLVLKHLNVEKALLCVKDHTAKKLNIKDGDRISEGVFYKILPDVYPMGDEISLIYQATGRVVKPGNLPISAGVIVYNVETCLNIASAVVKGEPVTKKWLTVGGDISNPRVVKVPVGTKVFDLFKALNVNVLETHVVIDGGPSMGKVINYENAVVTTRVPPASSISLIHRPTFSSGSSILKSKVGSSSLDFAFIRPCLIARYVACLKSPPSVCFWCALPVTMVILTSVSGAPVSTP